MLPMVRVFIASVIACIGFQQGAGQVPTFRSSVNAVPVYVLVTGPDGRTVTDLGQEEFSLRIDGHEREIATFSSAEQPITGVLLLDVSGNITNRFLRVKAAASYFVDALHDDDRVRIGSIGDEVAISPLLTSDKRVLHKLLDDELWLGGWSALWRAVDAGMTSLAREKGRRIMFVVSDGRNNGIPPIAHREVSAAVRNRAIAEGFVVCAIEIHGQTVHADLIQVTTATGGGRIALTEEADFRVPLSSLLNELRHQFLLGFVPAQTDGKFHALSVKVRRAGYRVRAPTQVFVSR